MQIHNPATKCRTFIADHTAPYRRIQVIKFHDISGNVISKVRSPLRPFSRKSQTLKSILCRLITNNTQIGK